MAIAGPKGLRFVSAGPQGVRLWDLGHETALYEEGLAETLYEEPWGSRRRLDVWPLCRSGYPRTEDGSGDVVVLGTRNGLDVHDAVTGQLLKHVETGPVLAVEPIPSPAGTAYVAVAGRSAWSVWDLVSGNAVHVEQRSDAVDLPTCVTTTLDGLPMGVWMAGGRNIRMVVWDPVSGTGTSTSYSLSTGIASPLSLAPVPTPHGAYTLIAVVSRSEIALVDLCSESIVTTLRPHGRTGATLRHPCAFLSHGRVLLAAATSTDVQLWDVAIGAPVARFQTPDTLALAAIPLNDGRTVLASGHPSGVRIWDPLTGELRHTLLTGAPVHALAVGSGPAGLSLHIHGPAGLATLTLDQRLL